ncbi:glycosyl transferase family 90-domain-containing protein [Mycena amicta]|nr:glycosyl transferase family 90-domain-containing protein [Mycena amicta]
MGPPMYAVLRRRSLRRPVLLLAIFFTLFWFGPLMRDVVFDAQHSTKIAFKLAGGPSTTLRQAVAEYTRYDVWWGFVIANNVQLPDEYDQIDRDLAPFYGGLQRDWEAHADSYTIGKDHVDEGLSMLNFTLPENEQVRFELAKGAFQMIELLAEVQHELPAFRAWELQQQALEAAKKSQYIDLANPPPAKYGWLAACPPFSPARLDALPLPFDESHPNAGKPSVPGTAPSIFDIDYPAADFPPKTFIHNHRPAMDPCLHPSHLRTHGAYLPHGDGPGPQRSLIPQFSYSTTPLHSDIRPALPLNWVPDDYPLEGCPPPLGLSWDERTDERIQWRGSNTGIWHAADGRWREAHRVRLVALSGSVGSANVSVLVPPSAVPEESALPVGLPQEVPRTRYVNSLLDIAFAGRPINCEPSECKKIEKMFEMRTAHDMEKASKYKFILDVDGNGWSSRFKRLMNSGSLIFKATTYPEWFTDRLAPWVHFVPIQNSYSDLLDALVFFRGDPGGRGAHDEMARRIADAGREWSRKFWRKEDLVAYNYRLFLEYGRVMNANREEMSFVMWDDVHDDEARERALVERWKRR